MATEFVVRGEPYPFATRGERIWKQILDDKVASNAAGALSRGAVLHFGYTPALHNGYMDIDNICEPVFAVALNRKRWFGGSRANLQWFVATKSVRRTPGVTLTFTQENHRIFEVNEGSVLLDSIYPELLPHSGRDERCVSWVTSESSAGASHWGRFSVLLQFASGAINIGDIATGRVKNIIDCLFPVLGGSVGAPHDHLIDFLHVEKGVSTLDGDSVRVVVCGMAPE